MSRLSDALMEYAQLGVIDRATVRRLSDAAEHDLAPLRGERDRLIDAIMPNPKGVDDAIAHLAGEREFAETAIARMCELISVHGSANGLEGDYPDPVEGLAVLLRFYSQVRAERDNLAGTAELCCLPVDGEASLCDRIRAAGDAQMREAERHRPALVVYVNGCTHCPFNRPTSISNEATHGCALAHDRDTPYTAPAPSWCPLRTGPVTVEGEK